ncbi:MAG TPA: tartrate-resistant acid phosphatase type 5 family protein [Candidatus Methylacidiphilales bacterium]
METTRRAFVQTLFTAATVAAVPAWAAPVPPPAVPAAEPGALRFFALGDWGRRGEPHQRAVAARMGEEAARVSPAFVLALGDNFYEDGVVSASDPQWQTSFEEVYTAPSLHVPWYAVLGNHDYHSEPDAQIAYAAASPRWRMPARYYSRRFAIGTGDGKTQADFFFIDTNPMVNAYLTSGHLRLGSNTRAQDVEGQVAWLRKALRESDAAWKIVVGHHPLYSGGLHDTDQLDIRARLLPVFKEGGVRAYFCGHDHDLQHIASEGIDHFVSGGGSTVRDVQMMPESLFARKVSGFASVALGPETLRLAYVDEAGKEIYSASLPCAAAPAHQA